MPTLIWSKVKDGLDPSMKKKAYAFFEKLQESDELPGLHIEPIVGSLDPRVRTGRVDDNFRCVLFKITAGNEPVYVIHGVWKHDDANRLAERVRLSMNPINGVPEVERVIEGWHAEARAATAPAASPAASTAPEPVSSEPSPAPPVDAPATDVQPAADEPSSAWSDGLTAGRLNEELGIDTSLAQAALSARTEGDLVSVLDGARVGWQVDALLELATGATVEQVRQSFHLDQVVDVSDEADEDERLLASLEHPAAKASFHWIEGNEELRRIIEAGDLGQWRLFLHPEQRAYVEGHRQGTFRLSGGAGTGKTVVAIHRARHLHRQDPQARILLTTFTRNLAEDLAGGLSQLDASIDLQTKLGAPGVYARGIDQVAWAVVQRAGAGVEAAVAAVLGVGRTGVLKSSPDSLWQEAIEDAGSDLPPALATKAFLEAEYTQVVLPNRITSPVGYLRVRRAGRGVALDRGKRAAVWKVVESYRAKARALESTDFFEKAEIAAAWLDGSGDRPFDHVIVDEAQDLAPSRLKLLRSLVAEGPNDLFICEDSHQRIYGQKVVLGHVGINVRGGRSRRLTLNYRTTAQNLGWAMRVLSGADWTDLEGEAERHSYHSARQGPEPRLVPTSSTAAELDQAAAIIRSWLPEEGESRAVNQQAGRAPAPEAIAVLVRDRYRRDHVVSGLAERGLDTRSVDRETVRPGKPLVMTMHRAKGLEFTHVLLFGIAEGAVPRALKEYDTSEADMADALLRERALVYVASTRARDVLAVTWSGTRSRLLGAAVREGQNA